ncbi:hypothetical protein [Fodinibius salsisoli]|uniref:Uncharacterized protein n=1 Tax=Fodinibius salsisoli TaxID=2820877 RepID=A0ABT3PLR6_9BACT|nr:hypothetical protein [Fodinibius salsisoli]MCW9706810.1 hypothetical protein [Fodinibius salsisoli]
MNLSLISGFVIGSILLLSLVKVNLNLVETSVDSMNDHVAKINVDNIVPLVSHDFRKIGYGRAGTSVSEITATKITFQWDLDRDGTSEVVSWEWDQTQPVTETPNNNQDYVLKRTINGVTTEIKQGVIKFELSYYNEQNVPTTVLDEVRKVKVTLVCESAEPMAGKYMRAAWNKTFMPLSIVN